MQHKILDQYLTSGKVTTSSIKCVKWYRLFKSLTQNLNIKFLSLWHGLMVAEGVKIMWYKNLDQYLIEGKAVWSAPLLFTA